MAAAVPAGAIFYGKTRHRLDVVFDEALREETKDTARRLHEFIRAGLTPKAEYSQKCESCSLLNICLPKIGRGKTKASDYIKGAIEALKNEEIS